jgi:CTP synthase
MRKKVSDQSVEHEFYDSFPRNYKIGKTKYIIITGSVMSGVGKGTFSSCLAALLSCHGLKISPIKFDGYLNYDAGTLNPYRHGEVFVLADGTECDLDLGSYERALHRDLIKDNYITAGKIFKTIIDKERTGKYLGRDVLFIPHLTGEIKKFLRELAVKNSADVVLVEVGGTVGDLENAYFIEATRELRYEEGRDNVCFVNVTYIIQPGSLDEFKSKPAQLGIRKLMELGTPPDVVICRSEKPVGRNILEKLSVYSDVPVERIFNLYDIRDIYEIPLLLKKDGVDKAFFEMLKIKPKAIKSKSNFKEWESFVRKTKNAKKIVNIGIVGKYTNVKDSYISILKALEHSGPYLGARVEVEWIESSNLESKKNIRDVFESIDGIIIPGGFGKRGIEGKINAIKYARENKIPLLGLCLGMQLSVVEFARNVCGLKGANSTEFAERTKYPVISTMEEQKSLLKKEKFGATMRLGDYKCKLKKDTIAFKAYGMAKNVFERHRHRYEFNNKFKKIFEEKGMVFSGINPERDLVEIIELKNHPFFVATQFHPEFKSRPLQPHPLFFEFVKAAIPPAKKQKSAPGTKK